MAEIDELIKIREILEAIASKDGYIIERLPEYIKNKVKQKNTDLEK